MATLRLSMTREEWIALQLLQDRSARDCGNPLRVERVVNVGAAQAGQDISVTVACDEKVEDVRDLLFRQLGTVLRELRSA